MRLDQYLVDARLFESRTRAQDAIKSGLVRVDGVVADKPSMKVAEGTRVETDGDAHPYVSRGGTKLDAALEAFRIDPFGATCLDLGASTGGFTDALLSGGAAKVYAVDVGRDQLHETLRADPRVANLEATHVYDLTSEHISEPIDILVCDVSFISLKKALPPALTFCRAGAQLAVLIKPQFEVGRERLGKGGIVRGEDAVATASDVKNWFGGIEGWSVVGLIDSPIRGGDGNREFLLGAVKSA